MKIKWEPIKKWFGFTRRERSASFILLILIVLVLAFRYTVPERNISIEDISSMFSDIENNYGIETTGTLSSVELFSFDPNTASYDTLIMLGLESNEANTLISYRNKGGEFRKPDDIKKIYGIKENKAEELVPYVKIKQSDTGKIADISAKQKKILIDINSCDSSSLVTLPGIGQVLSVRIIKYRKLLGGYASIDQLKEVYGLPEETFDLIKDRFFVDTNAITRIRVNLADYKEFARIPYIEKYELTAILKYRELNGRIEKLSDLTENKLINEEKAVKVGPYLNFE